MQSLSRKDLMLGAVFAGFGALYGGTALMQLPMGTPLNMGPGFFPVVLSAILVALGLAIALRGLFMTVGPDVFGTFAWRGLAAISAATIAFGLTIQGLGLAPATFLTVVIASLASRKARPAGILLTALVLTVLCCGVFIYGLRLPVGLLGTWFR